MSWLQTRFLPSPLSPSTPPPGGGYLSNICWGHPCHLGEFNMPLRLTCWLKSGDFTMISKILNTFLFMQLIFFCWKHVIHMSGIISCRQNTNVDVHVYVVVATRDTRTGNFTYSYIYDVVQTTNAAMKHAISFSSRVVKLARYCMAELLPIIIYFFLVQIFLWDICFRQNNTEISWCLISETNLYRWHF